MKTEKKIKDIYGCNYVVPDGELYPLQKWYNQLLDKTVSEIDICDVSRMIRQKKFIDLAILKAINFLQKNLFVGEMYEGEILEKLSELESPVLAVYSDDLRDILSHSLEKSKDHEWLCKEEKEEFEKIVKNFFEKLQ